MLQHSLSFDHADTANQAAAWLINHGIPAVVHDETALQRFWMMSDPIGSAKVAIAEDGYPEAARLIREDLARGDSLFAKAWRCPECHGFRVQYPQFPRKGLLPTLSMDLLAAGKLLKKTFYCLDCHATWDPAKQPPVPLPDRTEPGTDRTDVAL